MKRERERDRDVVIFDSSSLTSFEALNVNGCKPTALCILIK